MSETSKDKKQGQQSSTAGSSSWEPTESQKWLTSPPWMGSTSSRSIRSMREQNYNSRMMLAAEQDFNREMAQYYDAAHTAYRYRQAGINPMLAMSGLSLGTAGSSSPSGNLPSASTTEMGAAEPIIGSVSALNDSAAQFVDTLKAGPDIKGKELSNQFDMLSLFDRLIKTKEEARKAGFDADFTGVEAYVSEQTKQDVIDNRKKQNTLLDEQASEAASNAMLTTLRAQYEPTKMNAETELIRQEISELGARIMVHKSAAKWYDASSYEAYMSALEHWQKAQGQLLDNRLMQATFTSRVKAEFLATLHAENNAGAENEFQTWYNIGTLMGGTRKAGIVTQTVIAGLHEIEDVGKTVGEVVADLKGVGIKDTPANRRYIEDMIQVRKEQLEYNSKGRLSSRITSKSYKANNETGPKPVARATSRRNRR